MPQERFSRRQVEISFRDFRDLVDDLMAAPFQTWDDSFTRLIVHCEHDPVMRVVTEPLRTNRTVDANKWYADCHRAGMGDPDCSYSLPSDKDNRTALLYQVFVKVHDDQNKLDPPLLTWLQVVFSVSEFDQMIARMNTELISKCTREISYRLDDILRETEGNTEVSRQAMVVFHDNSLRIHGNVQGSVVASGGSSIRGSQASFTSSADLVAALQFLHSLIHEVSEDQKQAVAQAVEDLVLAAKDGDSSVDEVAAAAQTVASASSGMKAWLMDILGKAVGGVAGAVVVAGIKLALGIS